MSKIKRAWEFDPIQADKMFYEISTHIRGIKAILKAALDMPCLQQRSLQEALDVLMLADDNLEQVVEKYDGRHELNFTHLMLKYKRNAELQPLLMDMLAHAADLSTDETWQEKAIDLCNRIARELDSDDRPAVLRIWIDLISARGVKVCRTNKNGERIPLINEPTNEDTRASCAGTHG